MKKVGSQKQLPAGSIAGHSFCPLHYQDVYSIPLQTDKTIDRLLNEVMVMPGWVESLMRLRNGIVRIVGLKTEDNRAHVTQEFYEVGAPSILFPVIARNENEIVTGDSDKHLDFRASLLIDRTESRLYLSTLVQFHNALGRLYFVPVKPFHKLIMKRLLRNYLRKL